VDRTGEITPIAAPAAAAAPAPDAGSGTEPNANP
jgi:hypothetical protein